MDEKELKELLQSENLDIKKLAQIAKLMKSGAIDNLIKEQDPVVSKTSKPEIGFKVEVNYPDFTITKTTPRTTKQLVFMVSQNSYFIRFLNNDNNPIETLTGDNYADFTSGMDEYKTENFGLEVENPRLFYTSQNFQEKLAKTTLKIGEKGRLIVRPSGTENLVRISVEEYLEGVDYAKIIKENLF